MKIVSFQVKGRCSWGLVEGDGIIDLGAVDGVGYRDASEALATETAMDIAMLACGRSPDIAIDDVELRPPVPRPAKILCVGLNYRSHVLEMGRPMPTHPTIFPRFSDTLIGHGAELVQPAPSGEFDFEGELAVVIGSPTWQVPLEQAEEHVLGYACFNDATARDFQSHSTQFTAGKNFPATGAFGPWIVTRDEAPGLAGCSLTTTLNDVIVQQSTIDDLIFTVPELISYVSSWTPLSPGDVIVTGTPGGVGAGRNPKLWMSAGDRCVVEIDGIGRLENVVTS